jgi:signal transduction histidine kinase
VNVLRIFERPPVRSRRWWAFDVVVLLFFGLLSLPDVHRSGERLLLAILVVGAQVLPILLRRIWPVRVFWTVLVLAALACVINTDLAAGGALVVALYTVASTQPRRESLLAAAGAELLVLVATGATDASDWYTAAILLSGLVAAALGLGLYAGTRRAYLVELRDRAERLERERDQQSELAAAGERARIAREMHDIVAHHLTVMVALSDGAAAASANAPEQAAEVMRTVSATGRQALADTRRLLGVLRDDSDGHADGSGELHPVPDLSGLDALVAGVRAAGLPVSYEIQGTGELPSGAQLTVYRLVQEALTNTLKHGGSGASAVVRLRYLPGELHLDIQDDGAGASAPRPLTPGRGLAGMRERVHAFGGEVESGPRTPRGWTVSAWLQLEDTMST